MMMRTEEMRVEGDRELRKEKEETIWTLYVLGALSRVRYLDSETIHYTMK